MPDTPATRRERLSLSVTAQALAGPPARAGKGEGARTVVASSRGVKRMTLTEDEEKRLALLPERVAGQVRTLLERGWFRFAGQEMRAGRNPGGKGWKRVLCQALIDGNVTRTQLQLALVGRLELTPASAKVQASLAIAVFTAGGLCREVGGVLRLSSN